MYETSSLKQPLVSIAIPTYNRADSYLKGAINCALNQTYQNIEIIISNNCSTDNTEEVVNEFDDNRIRYFGHKKNIGANNNFNFCVEQAQGDFIVFLHDDDRIDADFAETCIKAINGNTETGVIFTGTRLIDSNGNTVLERRNLAGNGTPKEFFHAWFHNKTPLYMCSTLFNAKKLREIGGFSTKHNLFQDVDSEAKLLVKYGRVDIPDVKASFRRHEDNRGSFAEINAWCEDSLDLLDTICDLIPEHAEMLRQEGLPFFCRMNLGRASKIGSPYRRLIAYLKVARMFEKTCHPLKYAVNKDFRPRLRAQKAKLKSLIGLSLSSK